MGTLAGITLSGMARDDWHHMNVKTGEVYDRAYWREKVRSRLVEQGSPYGRLPRETLERIGRELGPFLLDHMRRKKET
jgi:hypothetical protein